MVRCTFLPARAWRPAVAVHLARKLGITQVQIRTIRPSEVDAARLLLQANNWGKRVADPKTFAELVSRSQVTLVAVED